MNSSTASASTATASTPVRGPGRRLRYYRLAARLSQTDLASLSHIPQSHISAFESGARRPGPRRTARIAAVLGVEVEELFRS